MKVEVIVVAAAAAAVVAAVKYFNKQPVKQAVKISWLENFYLHPIYSRKF